MPLDEVALRKPGHRGDVAITLGDGQSWHLPRPVVEFRLAFDDGSPSFRKADLGLGARYWSLYESFMDAPDAAAQLNAGAALCVALLRQNYEIDDAGLSGLLPWRPDDATNKAMWDQLLALATGRPDPEGGRPDDT